MSETWYLGSAAGAPCGPGTRRALATSAGAVTSLEDLASEHTWNRVESRRWLAAGEWSVRLNITVVDLAPARVTAVIERRDPNCSVIQTLLDQQSGVLAQGEQVVTLSQNVTTTTGFRDGDLLTLRLKRSQGGGTVTVRFDNAALADSAMTNPDVAPPLLASGEILVSAGARVTLDGSGEIIIPPGPDIPGAVSTFGLPYPGVTTDIWVYRAGMVWKLPNT